MASSEVIGMGGVQMWKRGIKKESEMEELERRDC